MGSRLFARSSMWLDNSEGARVYKAQLATDAQRYRWFADSPLEGGVSCELVSEVKFASRAPNGSIPRGLGTILGAVERLFRARTGNNRAKTQHFRHFWML